MKLYLAYGSNTSHEQMKQRCPEARYICNIRLQNHQLVFRHYADVVTARGKSVECAMWLITPEDELLLDRFEGFPRSYVKKYVRVTLDGRQHRVMFYVMRNLRAQNLPTEKYEARVRVGYADCGMSEEQVDDALARAKRWIASQPKPKPYQQGQLPLPRVAGITDVTGRVGRVVTEAEREREEENRRADEFFMALYGKAVKGPRG